MNSRRIVAFAFLFLPLPAVAAEAPPPAAPPVTLEQAFRAAVERTENVPLEKSRLEQSDARVDQARGRFLPSISVIAGQTRQSGGGLDDADARSTRATIAQSVYAGGRDQADLRARKKERAAQRNTVETARNAVFADVADAFYAVLASERDAENIGLSIKLMNERIKELKRRKSIGKSRNIDLLSADAQLSVLQAQLIAARGSINAARNRFALTTGLPRESALQETGADTPKPRALEEYLATIEARPDIIALNARMSAARAAVRAERAGHLPALDLTGSYFFDRTGSAREGSGWELGVSLTLPVFNGGITQARVREQSSLELQADLQLRRQRRTAETEIREAYDQLISANEQIVSLRKALEATEENFREHEKDYRFSLATNLDVIQALNTFLDTKRTLDRTKFDARAAWARLQAVTAQIPR